MVIQAEGVDRASVAGRPEQATTGKTLTGEILQNVPSKERIRI